MKDMSSVAQLVDEYSACIDGHLRTPDGNVDVDWNAIRQTLVRDCEWSELAAEHLSSLVQGYGAFVLRNALALAIVTRQDDGDYGL